MLSDETLKSEQSFLTNITFRPDDDDMISDVTLKPENDILSVTTLGQEDSLLCDTTLRPEDGSFNEPTKSLLEDETLIPDSTEFLSSLIKENEKRQKLFMDNNTDNVLLMDTDHMSKFNQPMQSILIDETHKFYLNENEKNLHDEDHNKKFSDAPKNVLINKSFDFREFLGKLLEDVANKHEFNLSEKIFFIDDDFTAPVKILSRNIDSMQIHNEKDKSFPRDDAHMSDFDEKNNIPQDEKERSYSNELKEKPLTVEPKMYDLDVTTAKEMSPKCEKQNIDLFETQNNVENSEQVGQEIIQENSLENSKNDSISTRAEKKNASNSDITEIVQPKSLQEGNTEVKSLIIVQTEEPASEVPIPLDESTINETTVSLSKTILSRSSDISIDNFQPLDEDPIFNKFKNRCGSILRKKNNVSPQESLRESSMPINKSLVTTPTKPSTTQYPFKPSTTSTPLNVEDRKTSKKSVSKGI